MDRIREKEIRRELQQPVPLKAAAVRPSGEREEESRKELDRLRPYSKRTRRGPMDHSLLLITLALIGFGVLMVSSASAPYALKSQNDASYYLKKDAGYAVLGVLIMLLTSFFDYRHFCRPARFFYLLSFLLCLAVFVPGLGVTVNNATRWLRLGSLSFMPSDLLKLSLIFLLAGRFSSMEMQEMRSFKTFAWVILLLAISILPIWKQPNFSAVVVLASIIIFIYFIAGMPARYLLLTLLILTGGLLAAFWPSENNYRLDRLKAMLDPLHDPMGSSWQLIQSLYAISSGGLTGVGFGQSRQKFDYLAEEPHNDFIFAVFSEEFGFIGAFLLITAYIFLIYRALLAARQAGTRFGRLVGYGISFVIALQSLINIGVSIGRMPTTGITLPFISYGGSSLLLMCFMMGVLLNISRDSA